MDKKKGVIILLLVVALTVGAGAATVVVDDTDKQFDVYADYILQKWEYQYINNAIEESKYAIVKEYYPNEDIKNMTLARAKNIVYVDYWQKIKAAEINPKIRLLYFDAAINQGQPTAVRLLQKVAGITIDARVGPQTIAASFNITAYMYANARLERYEEIAASKPDHAEYLPGWKNRLYDITQKQISLTGE